MSQQNLSGKFLQIDIIEEHYSTWVKSRKQTKKSCPQSLSLREKILFSRNVIPVESEFPPHSMDYLTLSLSQLRASSCFS